MKVTADMVSDHSRGIYRHYNNDKDVTDEKIRN